MASLYKKLDKADWSFVGTWVEEVAREAAAQVHRGRTQGFSDELDDLEQHAMLYVATHPKEIGKITSPFTLRKHLFSRLVRDFRGDWERDAGDENYGTESELYEGSGWDV